MGNIRNKIRKWINKLAIDKTKIPSKADQWENEWLNKLIMDTLKNIYKDKLIKELQILIKLSN